MNFLTALQNKQKTGAIPVIPDIKCFSPKDGDLLRSRDPVQIARDLADAGAPALSVVTEPKEFGGSLELLRSVCAAVSVPVLRKDFVTDRSDLKETLRRLSAEGRTVVMVTHDIEFAAVCADRCAMLFDGEIFAEGAPRAFFSDNNFYTTAANRIARGFYDNAVTVEDVVTLAVKNRQ